MAGLPYMKWYWRDWFADEQVTACSTNTRAIVIDALGRMHMSKRPTIKGTVEDLCKLLRCVASDLESALAELEVTKALEIRREKVIENAREIAVIFITSRRLKRDFRKARACSKAGRKGGGNPALRQKTDANPTFGSTYIGPSVSVSDICITAFGSGSESEGGAGETNGVHRQANSPLVIDALWRAYPAPGRSDYRAARLEIDAAIERVRASGRADPEGWLLDRVRAYASSPAGNAGRYTTKAANWFAKAKYDDAPESWQRATPAESSAPAPMTSERLDAILGEQKP